MRLIDADKLIEFIDTYLSKTCKRDGTTIPNRWYGALKRCVEEQPTIKKGEWILVSERLPEDDTRVLITTTSALGTESIVLEVSYLNGVFIRGFSSYTPSAWMPIPEPYKEGEHK